jgi:hypothetical protein
MASFGPVRKLAGVELESVEQPKELVATARRCFVPFPHAFVGCAR